MSSNKDQSAQVGKKTKRLRGDQETPILIKPGPGSGVDDRIAEYGSMAICTTNLFQSDFADPEFIPGDDSEDAPYYFVYSLRHPRKRLMSISIYLGEDEAEELAYHYDFPEGENYSIMLDYQISAPPRSTTKKPTKE